MIPLQDEAATEAFGARLARALTRFDAGLVLSLAGELGAGKTALARATLTALGHDGRVVSPSYTLVEPYPLGARTLFHLDLYRLGDPEELEFLGIREIDSARDWLFVEWAERGAGHLPSIDIELDMAYAAPTAPSGRSAQVNACSARGKRFLTTLEKTT